ncbi:DUF1422 family protein, partial [Aeromonas salmonicida]|uniref:DUF1422 family protein n=1 Tax=Aeromonas salmonicida TaxID=645 RepID=UPI003D32374B
VPFSFFPMIALGLAAYQLYQHYRHVSLEGNTPVCMLLCFFIGGGGQAGVVKGCFLYTTDAADDHHAEVN